MKEPKKIYPTCRSSPEMRLMGAFGLDAVCFLLSFKTPMMVDILNG